MYKLIANNKIVKTSNSKKELEILRNNHIEAYISYYFEGLYNRLTNLYKKYKHNDYKVANIVKDILRKEATQNCVIGV